ncbi:MAG: DUF1223 domain-containing protein, partial [Pseudomonadota bacterium]
MKSRNSFISTLVGLLAGSTLLGLAAFNQSARAGGPVLVELFTSQGCNSCPPADQMLGKLAQQDDVIALAFHVTYWDRLGWVDSFGDPVHDDRQRHYRQKLGRGLYTPQMVIAGQADVVGGHPQIPRAVAALTNEISPQAITIDEAGGLVLPRFEGVPVELWAAVVENHQNVAIQRGENRGKSLDYHR